MFGRGKKKGDKYILIKNDVVEIGYGETTKHRQMRLKNALKHPKHAYTDDRGNKVFLFFDRLPQSVKFDFSLYKEYTDQLRQEVQNIQDASELIMSNSFAKSILDIDQNTMKLLVLIVIIVLFGGLVAGILLGMMGVFVFMPCHCPPCSYPNIIMPT